jgi:hypothetical protein
MSAGRTSALRQGLLAGIVTFVVGILPTAGILWSANTGSIGSVSTPGFGGVAVIVIGAISVGSGYLVTRAYAQDPERRPGDVWTTWYGGFVVFVLGTWFSPFLVLLIFVNSDAALNDRLPLVLAVWTLLHLAFAALALALARGLLRPTRSGRESVPPATV